jgi:hypothetical protein
MHTSPDRDARLLPWIDATGPLLDGGMVDMPGGLPGAAMHACSSQAPAAREWRKGYYRLMTCLSHENHERCKVCNEDF